MEEAEKIVRDLESKLENSEKMRNRLAEQYDDISGWAELYDTCDLAAKKMIVSRLMKEVRVRRDYEIEIELTASCEALGISLDKPIVFKESAQDIRAKGKPANPMISGLCVPCWWR